MTRQDHVEGGARGTWIPRWIPVVLVACLASAAGWSPAGALSIQIDASFDDLIDAARHAGAAGEWERARALLERAVLLRPGDATVRFELGLARERSDDPVEAMAAYREALERSPGLVAAAENLAALLRRRGSLDEAEHVIRGALERSPEAGSLQYHLALVMFERDQRLTAPAITALERARDLGFREPHLFLLLARVARHSGESGKAEALARQGLQLSSDDPALEHELGMAMAAAGRPAEAVPWLSRAVQGAPGDPQLVEDLAMVKLRAGDPAGTVELLERAVTEHPEHADLLYLLARAQRRMGDPEAAATMRRFEERQQASRARRSAGERAMVEVREGVDAWGQGRLADAATRFRAALEERPGWTPAKAYLAATLLEIGDVREARALAREIREDDPGNAQALMVLGRSFLEEDPGRGIRLLEEAVARHPYRVVCLLSLAEAYLGRGRDDDAAGLLDRAAEVEPDNAWLHALRSRLPDGHDSKVSPTGDGSPEHAPDVWLT